MISITHYITSSSHIT